MCIYCDKYKQQVKYFERKPFLIFDILTQALKYSIQKISRWYFAPSLLLLPTYEGTPCKVRGDVCTTAIFNLHFNSCPAGLSYPFLELGLKFPLEAIYDVRTCSKGQYTICAQL